MKIGIAGAGVIAKGYYAFLTQRGHCPTIWSPSGNSTEGLQSGDSLIFTGAIETEFKPLLCDDPEKLAKNDVIILALPANGHRLVLDALIPHLHKGHTLIISGQLSFSALYASKQLASLGIQLPIVAWNTTAVTAKAPVSPNKVNIGIIRKNINMAVVPDRLRNQGLETCESLFGRRFTLQDDLLDIALSNLNPQDHLAIALCNLTRIEKGEEWLQNSNSTGAVCNLMEALDEERVAIANALGKTVIKGQDALASALDTQGASLARLHKILVDQGRNPLGPKSLGTRYVLEDVPFGLVPTTELASLTGTVVPLHQSGIAIMNACYQREFRTENNIMPELRITSKDQLFELVTDGYRLSD